MPAFYVDVVEPKRGGRKYPAFLYLVLAASPDDARTKVAIADDNSSPYCHVGKGRPAGDGPFVLGALRGLDQEAVDELFRRDPDGVRP